jgi:hypothetical protein
MPHPFRIHDVQFHILDRSGVPPPPEEAGQKEVVLVYPGENLRFITRFEDHADPDIPYMYHCHYLAHEDGGMMRQFVVVNPNAGAPAPAPVSVDITSVRPDPVHGVAELIFGAEPGPARLALLDVLGREMAVLFEGGTTSGEHAIRFDAATVAAGYYVLRLESADGVDTRALTVVH